MASGMLGTRVTERAHIDKSGGAANGIARIGKRAYRASATTQRSIVVVGALARARGSDNGSRRHGMASTAP